MRAASLAAVAVVLVLAGCGGGGAPAHHIPLTAFERHGKTLFIHTCGICHTLADAGTTGIAGPSLDTPWKASLVRKSIAEGLGGMPPRLLTGRAAAEVAAYVAAATK